MAIIKRTRADGSPAYRVVVHTPTQGHQTIGTFSRKKDAELVEAEYTRKSRLEGVVYLPKRITFLDLSDAWLATRRVKPQTSAQYRSRREHMVDYFGNRLISTIDRHDCELFLTFMSKEKLAPRTCNAIFKLFRQVMQYAVECGYLQRNPAVGVRSLPNKGGKSMRLIAPQDHQRLVQATSEPFRTLVYLLPFCGLRMGEVIALTWEDIDTKACTITVHRQRLKSGHYSDTKTASSARVVSIPKMVAKELKAWRLRCLPTQEGLVFPNPWGGVMSYSYFYENIIYPLRKIEGFETLGTHDFRHTFVSWSIAQGADIKYIQAQCGHASASVTLDVYGHLFTDERISYADRLGDWYVTTSLPQDAKAQVTAL